MYFLEWLMKKRRPKTFLIAVAVLLAVTTMLLANTARRKWLRKGWLHDHLLLSYFKKILKPNHRHPVMILKKKQQKRQRKEGIAMATTTRCLVLVIQSKPLLSSSSCSQFSKNVSKCLDYRSRQNLLYCYYVNSYDNNSIIVPRPLKVNHHRHDNRDDKNRQMRWQHHQQQHPLAIGLLRNNQFFHHGNDNNNGVVVPARIASKTFLPIASLYYKLML
ncbi:hypothetical protein BDB00DRAFT_349040 [Zychaea mexicana]|uniref:uncharacterized protein n=1 Tax=Zychaea mexicana TaxID=64656 RepID=UPI0022FDC5B6|nr:uncharacterized protein BDB00DRAFT_349040 [Zychaea mexicana]KAI9493871.1 hypothetical protein BDB00DRAFT_349040 [Zychaea mexicana]